MSDSFIQICYLFTDQYINGNFFQSPNCNNNDNYNSMNNNFKMINSIYKLKINIRHKAEQEVNIERGH